MKRLESILLFNLGRYDDLLDTRYWQLPPETAIVFVDGAINAGMSSGLDRSQRFIPYYSGLRINFRDASHTRKIEIRLTCNDYHQINVLSEGDSLYQTGFFSLSVVPHKFNELASYRISLPQEVWEQGFDSILINSLEDGHYQFAGIEQAE